MQSMGREGCLELRRRASADTVGAGVMWAAKCPPPIAILRSGESSARVQDILLFMLTIFSNPFLKICDSSLSASILNT
jgi:hypothetical protein